ncbi:MAG: tetratricopeptide repeat protein, partial [Nitrosomonadales bacterium]|nr:tetratricopeptide repeat protein [Nitrosomonadales bacterium]
MDTHFNLGNALKHLGRLDEAAASYRRALQLNPGFAAAHNNLGATLKDMGRFEEAAASYRRAVELQPDSADAHNNLGTALKELNRLDEAVASYRRALQLNPGYAEVHGNLGNAYKELGQVDDALNSYRRTLQLKPDLPEIFSSLLLTLNYTASQSTAECLAEARRYGQLVSGKASAPFSSWNCDPEPQRLRVGMVSGDLCNHPVGFFLEGLLAHIDPARIELVAYPTCATVDALTRRIQPYFSAWKPLLGLSDEQAARLIHADGVHVLIDLSGHTGRNNRLPVFAWRPAPVQASWLGYFATTGVAEMDYLLADRMGVPEEHRAHFTETIHYLPET